MDPKVELNQQDARQGKTGMNVRYVLIAGLFLVIVALGATALFVH